MRRAGQNPTESETQDMVNKIDDGSSSLNFEVKKKYLNVEGNNINCLLASWPKNALKLCSMAGFLLAPVWEDKRNGHGNTL